MTGSPGAWLPETQAQRRVAWIVTFLNILGFAIEFAVARFIGSVSLFADSIDFLEDASLNCLVAVALAWSPRQRARLGMALAGIILLPAVATLSTAWAKFDRPVAPDAALLSVTASGALAINLCCAVMLAGYRFDGGSLIRAAFLSARNDVLANLAMIVAGLLTVSVWRSAWPDLITGLGIIAVNADAATDVWQAARQEHRGEGPEGQRNA